MKTNPNYTWEQINQNLINRRANNPGRSDNANIPNPIADYHLHMQKVFVGESVLDVGAGSMFLKKCLPNNVAYFPIDPYPVSDEVAALSIENLYADNVYDTVCAMACLDMCMDFDKAIENIKSAAKKNVVILTGLDIPCNEYHSYELTLKDFTDRFASPDWKMGYCEYFGPNVALLEFIKYPYTRVSKPVELYIG